MKGAAGVAKQFERIQIERGQHEALINLARVETAGQIVRLGTNVKELEVHSLP